MDYVANIYRLYSKYLVGAFNLQKATCSFSLHTTNDAKECNQKLCIFDYSSLR